MIEIRKADLSDAAVQALLADHHAMMRAISPPDTCHVLAPEELADAALTLWSAWDGDELLGCGGLKALAPDHGEIKSMRARDAHRGRGVGQAILAQIEDEARARGYRRLSLETGNSGDFAPALGLYRRNGFIDGAPFAGYAPTPFTIFLHKEL